MCWPALSALPCARAPQLYPHKEYVITGEPGLTDDRVWSHNAGRRESFCPGAIIRLTTASSSVFGHCQNFLQVSSSLCHRLPFCFFMFWPSSLPDVPGYMPLLSVVQGTKTITRKEARRGEKGEDESVNLQLAGRYISTGWFCDIQDDLECPVFLLLMFENACGTIMIGYYVGFREGEFFYGVVLVFGATSKPRVPRLWIVSSDCPLSLSGPITPEQWTHKQWHYVFFKHLSLASLWKYIEFPPWQSFTSRDKRSSCKETLQLQGLKKGLKWHWAVSGFY